MDNSNKFENNKSSESNINRMGSQIFPSDFIFREISKLDIFPVNLKDELEKIISVKIKKIDIFKQALIHRSIIPLLHKKIEGNFNFQLFCNERLEFIGDSIYNFIISDYLFRNHPFKDEGQLSSMRAKLVNRAIMGEIARQLGLGDYIQISNNTKKMIELGNLNVLSNLLEAIVGAIYIDSGYGETKQFILSKLLPMLQEQHPYDTHNYKSELMEFLQSQDISFPTYKVLFETGPDHLKTFLVGAYVNGKLLGTAIANSKKEAEQSAAKKVLELYKKIS